MRCEECDGRTVFDEHSGDVICQECGVIVSNQFCFGDYCEPWLPNEELESNVPKNTKDTKDVDVADEPIKLPDRYLSVCNRVSAFTGLSVEQRKRFYKKCNSFQDIMVVHKPVNVVLAILHTQDPSILDESCYVHFETTKNSVTKICKLYFK